MDMDGTWSSGKCKVVGVQIGDDDATEYIFKNCRGIERAFSELDSPPALKAVIKEYKRRVAAAPKVAASSSSSKQRAPKKPAPEKPVPSKRVHKGKRPRKRLKKAASPSSSEDEGGGRASGSEGGAQATPPRAVARGSPRRPAKKPRPPDVEIISVDDSADESEEKKASEDGSEEESDEESVREYYIKNAEAERDPKYAGVHDDSDYEKDSLVASDEEDDDEEDSDDDSDDDDDDESDDADDVQRTPVIPTQFRSVEEAFDKYLELTARFVAEDRDFTDDYLAGRRRPPAFAIFHHAQKRIEKELGTLKDMYCPSWGSQAQIKRDLEAYPFMKISELPEDEVVYNYHSDDESDKEPCGMCNHRNPSHPLEYQVVLHGEKYRGRLLWEAEEPMKAVGGTTNLERLRHTWMDEDDGDNRVELKACSCAYRFWRYHQGMHFKYWLIRKLFKVLCDKHGMDATRHNQCNRREAVDALLADKRLKARLQAYFKKVNTQVDTRRR